MMKIKSFYGMSEVLDVVKGKDRANRNFTKFKIADPDNMYSHRLNNVWLIYFAGGEPPVLEGSFTKKGGIRK